MTGVATAPSTTSADRSGKANVRPLASGEERALAEVMRRSFGGLGTGMFSGGEATFVAELDGRMVGGVVLTSFRIDASRRGGMVKWLFTLPEARARGVASRLLDRGLAWFDEVGVTDAFTCIEALNAPSRNRFAQRGFEPVGFVEQVRRYGARLPLVWWHTNHVVDVGDLLWVQRRDDAAEDRAAAGAAALDGAQAFENAAGSWGLGGLVATLAVHAGFVALMLARMGVGLDAATVGRYLLAIALIVGVRTGAMALVGAAAGVRLRYHPWETGMLLVGAITLVFGRIVFLAPGIVVPRQRTWSTRELAPVLARMGFAGAGAVMALGALAAWAVSAGVATGVASPLLLYARIMVLLDVLLPFFPLTAFSGMRMLQASRAGWALMAVGAIALWVVAWL